MKTASAIILAGAVAIPPSDHDVDDDAAFMARVEGAIEAVAARPDTIVLLGVQPDRPESQYGWIEPDDVVLGPWSWPARPFSNISSVARCQPSPTRSARSVPSTLPPGKAKPPTSRTRASSPLISRAMSWSRVPSGSRCFRSPGPRRRTWATPRALASHARASGVSSDCGARGTTAFRCGRRRPATPRIGLGPRRRPRNPRGVAEDVPHGLRREERVAKGFVVRQRIRQLENRGAGERAVASIRSVVSSG